MHLHWIRLDSIDISWKSRSQMNYQSSYRIVGQFHYLCLNFKYQYCSRYRCHLQMQGLSSSTAIKTVLRQKATAKSIWCNDWNLKTIGASSRCRTTSRWCLLRPGCSACRQWSTRLRNCFASAGAPLCSAHTLTKWCSSRSRTSTVFSWWRATWLRGQSDRLRKW